MSLGGRVLQIKTPLHIQDDLYYKVFNSEIALLEMLSSTILETFNVDLIGFLKTIRIMRTTRTDIGFMVRQVDFGGKALTKGRCFGGGDQWLDSLAPKQMSAIQRADRIPELQPLLFRKAKG